jgi:predicted nucleotidyltransferase component of viral defense system
VSKHNPSALATSVRQRLLDLSRERGEDFQLILTWYASERLLYRLGSSKHAETFVLKGAMLFPVWDSRSYRPTKDLDLLGYGDASSERLTAIFKEICQSNVEPDGLDFDVQNIRVAEIREDQEYQGQRVQIIAYLGRARINLQIDIGFGDVITPAAEEINYPTLLDFPAPHIRAYPRETVIAEKLQAMVALGMLNSRMKDFYDTWMIARRFEFQGTVLAEAIKSTFNRRNTEIPASLPSALSDEFASDPGKITQWTAFLRRTGLEDSAADLDHVIDELRTFLMPPVVAAARGEVFDLSWTDGGPWS